jgi:hypothetical protein
MGGDGEGLLTRSPTPRLTAQWDVHGQRLSAWLKIGLLIGFATSANAVEVSPERVTAKEVLRGRFTQERVLAGFSKPLVSTGTFVLVPGRGLIWQSESPFRTTVVVTDAGITQLVDGQEAMKVPASRLPGLSPLYRAMAAAISGDTAGLEKSFAVARNNDATHWSVRLVPSGVDGSMVAQVKSLTLNGSRFVDHVDVDKGGGDADHMSFTDQRAGPIDLSADEQSLLGKQPR